MVIRRSTDADFPAMLAIINDAAQAYRGMIPDDRWHEPYMPAEELTREITTGGIVFWVADHEGQVAGVMGIQDKGDVALVRHAYVASTTQRAGVGTQLLRHVEGLVEKPVLIGTWAAASWAIEFYQRNGFTVVPAGEKDRLLRTYWSIPERQIETSVVLGKGYSSGVMDERHLRNAVAAGLADVAAGRTIPHAQVRARIAALLSSAP
jgi:N-acetylglutamate synthase-like GNAT family acetyltransferase